MDRPFGAGVDDRLVRQRRRPAREHGNPLQLGDSQWSGVVDVHACMHPDQFPTPQHPADLLRRDLELEELPPCDDAVLQR